MTGRRDTDQTNQHNSSGSNKPLKVLNIFESGVFSRENRAFTDMKEEHKSGITKNTESINEDSYE